MLRVLDIFIQVSVWPIQIFNFIFSPDKGRTQELKKNINLLKS